MKSVIVAGVRRRLSSYRENDRARGLSGPVLEIELRCSSLSNAVLMKRKKVYMRTTRMLLVVSTTFLLLNAPLALSKVRYFLDDLIFSKKTDSPSHLAHSLSANETATAALEWNYSALDELIERLSCYMYYFNFSVHFLLYMFNGPKFKNALDDVLKSARLSRTSTATRNSRHRSVFL
jgi:hypothetical protein